MAAKLLVGLAVILFSISCVAQVAPAANTHPPLSTSLGGGMDFFSGDWGTGDINRWGPTAWGTVTIWHDLSLIAEGHSMNIGGNDLASHYKYYAGGGGLIYTSGYWGRFQPYVKGEAGFASLSHPGNFSGHNHQSSNIWTLGGGFEYHTAGKFWINAGYTYDFFPDFHSSVSGLNHTLNPRGFIFGGTYRFGPYGNKF